MNTIVSKGLLCALFVGGLSLLGATAAHAADLPNQLTLPEATSSAAPTSVTDVSSAGILSNTARADVVAPSVAVVSVAVGLNAHGVSADAVAVPSAQLVPSADDVVNAATASAAEAAAKAAAESAATAAASAVPADISTVPAVLATPLPAETPTGGLLTDATVSPALSVPVTVTDNSVEILNGAILGQVEGNPVGDTPASGVLDGSTVSPTVSAPVTVSDNSVNVLNGGVAGGSTVSPTVSAPVTVSNNSVSVPNLVSVGSLLGRGLVDTNALLPAVPGVIRTPVETVTVAPVVSAPIVVSCNSLSVLGSSANGCGGTVPTVPVAPTTPVEIPVMPVAPVIVDTTDTPAISADTSTDTALDTAAPGVIRAGTVAGASSGTAVLAYTGGDGNPFLALMALLALLIGAGALKLARRTQLV